MNIYFILFLFSLCYCDSYITHDNYIFIDNELLGYLDVSYYHCDNQYYYSLSNTDNPKINNGNSIILANDYVSINSSYEREFFTFDWFRYGYTPNKYTILFSIPIINENSISINMQMKFQEFSNTEYEYDLGTITIPISNCGEGYYYIPCDSSDPYFNSPHLSGYYNIHKFSKSLFFKDIVYEHGGIGTKYPNAIYFIEDNTDDDEYAGILFKPLVKLDTCTGNAVLTSTMGIGIYNELNNGQLPRTCFDFIYKSGDIFCYVADYTISDNSVEGYVYVTIENSISGNIYFEYRLQTSKFIYPLCGNSFDNCPVNDDLSVSLNEDSYELIYSIFDLSSYFTEMESFTWNTKYQGTLFPSKSNKSDTHISGLLVISLLCSIIACIILSVAIFLAIVAKNLRVKRLSIQNELH